MLQTCLSSPLERFSPPFPQGLDKTALIALVATETERQASWSRLEGLILHWGATDAAGGAWGLPPQGWGASPNKVVDAGGPWGGAGGGPRVGYRGIGVQLHGCAASPNKVVDAGGPWEGVQGGGGAGAWGMGVRSHGAR